MKFAPRLALALLVMFLIASASADERIDRAQAFSRRISGNVFRHRLEPHWLEEGKHLWYRVETGRNREAFVLVDTTTGEKQTSAKFADLNLPPPEPIRTRQATLDRRRSQAGGVASGLRFSNTLDRKVQLWWIDPQGELVEYETIDAGAKHQQPSYHRHQWLLRDEAGTDLARIEVGPTIREVLIDGEAENEVRERRAPRGGGGQSPDRKWVAYVEEGNLLLRNRDSGVIQPLKTDLDPRYPVRGGITWAPDSQAFVVSYAEKIEPRQITIVESTPDDQLQPKLRQVRYVKPGDPLPRPVPVLFRIENGKATPQPIDTKLFDHPFTESTQLDIEWADDSSEFYFDYNARGHQTFRIIAVDRATALPRAIVEETSPTFIDYTSKTWRHWLPATSELLWMSERDGWAHLYLVDLKTGAIKNQLTQGAWVVRKIEHVDSEQRQVWFMASGRRAGEDPYHLHLCRVNFDGTGLVQLTEGDGTHSAEFSPDRQLFIDRWSRVDQPPVHQLRRSSDGSLVAELESAEITALLETGVQLPERFVAKGRDGVTDIHGFLVKPSNFDPNKKYPIVEDIYAGPHSAFVPKEFGPHARYHTLAELGFIVVKIDGMGTNHRGKAFHDVCYKNLKDAGFPDRIAWIKAAAAERPYMDLSRVGIIGGSAGGQNAMRALLDHHDFYHVAVADCGCHDNRMDKIWWNEQWMGYPVDESYAQNSNMVDASKLEGHLLLIVGELDTNVDPASTAQVVAALQRARKTFDYMPIMGAGHGAAETPFGSQLRSEFLLRHLQP